MILCIKTLTILSNDSCFNTASARCSEATAMRTEDSPKGTTWQKLHPKDLRGCAMLMLGFNKKTHIFSTGFFGETNLSCHGRIRSNITLNKEIQGYKAPSRRIIWWNFGCFLISKMFCCNTKRTFWYEILMIVEVVQQKCITFLLGDEWCKSLFLYQIHSDPLEKTYSPNGVTHWINFG